jgi:predicted RNase H-like nuclease (RuvC/YqgF family)
METTLADIVEMAETWPKETQEKLLRYAEQLAKEHGGVYRLTPEERADVEAALAEMDAGRFASDEEVAEVFNRYRL